jgi:hypothetical protein
MIAFNLNISAVFGLLSADLISTMFGAARHSKICVDLFLPLMFDCTICHI